MPPQLLAAGAPLSCAATKVPYMDKVSANNNFHCMAKQDLTGTELCYTQAMDPQTRERRCHIALPTRSMMLTNRHPLYATTITPPSMSNVLTLQCLCDDAIILLWFNVTLAERDEFEADLLRHSLCVPFSTQWLANGCSVFSPDGHLVLTTVSND